MNIFFGLFVVFFFAILASIESNDILITIDLLNIFSFWQDVDLLNTNVSGARFFDKEETFRLIEMFFY